MAEYDFERERNEAIEAGHSALQSLYQAKEELDKARGWGIWDILGGGLISGLIKHSKMKRAADYIEDAKFQLRRFDRELRDVNMSGINLETDGFLGFADILFDGFLSDVMMQSRISDAREQVEDAIQRVQRIMDRLYDM